MADFSSRERWDTWMVQAQKFAEREVYMEAMARADLVLQECDLAIAQAVEPELRTRLERYRYRAERRKAKFREQFEVWNARIAARRSAATLNAATEMARPLPLGPTEPI